MIFFFYIFLVIDQYCTYLLISNPSFLVYPLFFSIQFDEVMIFLICFFLSLICPPPLYRPFFFNISWNGKYLVLYLVLLCAGSGFTMVIQMFLIGYFTLLEVG